MSKFTRREVLKTAISSTLVGSGIIANRSIVAATDGSDSQYDPMNPTIKPPKLGAGDTVGIVSPASAYYPIHDRAFKRGIAHLKKIGLRVKTAPHTRDQRQHLNPPAHDRADDLNQMFADSDVNAIICLCGGSGANAVLPLLDLTQIRKTPKVVMGYSANTAILNGIFVKTGLVTFHGPMILNGFSEYPEPFSYTRQQFERMFFDVEPAGKLEPPEQWTDDFPSEDRPRSMKTNPGWRWLREGTASGLLVGGNLWTVLTLAGTPYWPISKGVILCLEEVNFGDGKLLLSVDQWLAQCQQIGVFDQIAGLIVGKANNVTEEERELFDALVLKHTSDHLFPILVDVDFGHTAPRLTLPIGVQASLDSSRDLFSLDEGAVV